MRKKNYEGRCEKKSVQKCNEIFKAYDAVQSAYVNVLSSRDDIIEIRCNVTLEDMEYTSDFCVFETYIPCTDTELFEAIGNVRWRMKQPVGRGHLTTPKLWDI